MVDIDRFPSQTEKGFGEKMVTEKEFHMPHPHVLSPFQKFLTVVELVFVGWLLYTVIKAIINNIVFLSHVL